MMTMTPKAKNEGKERFAIAANGADENYGLRVLAGALLILTPSRSRSGSGLLLPCARL